MFQCISVSLETREQILRLCKLNSILATSSVSAGWAEPVSTRTWIAKVHWFKWGMSATGCNLFHQFIVISRMMFRVKEVAIKVLNTLLIITWIASCLCSPYWASVITSLLACKNIQILTPLPSVKIVTFLEHCSAINALMWYYHLQI